jgi:hypothetical protein
MRKEICLLSHALGRPSSLCFYHDFHKLLSNKTELLVFFLPSLFPKNPNLRRELFFFSFASSSCFSALKMPDAARLEMEDGEMKQSAKPKSFPSLRHRRLRLQLREAKQASQVVFLWSNRVKNA